MDSSSNRTLETIIRNVSPHWVGNGFYVKQYIPTHQICDVFQKLSPFLLLDYNDRAAFKGTEALCGVGPHPHRGIETVTFALEGAVEHGDNQGNRGVIYPGDIQWMTAGDGILHKEYHETQYARQDRILHMIQLWVDLPREHKRTKPGYQAISASSMGKRVFDGGSELIVYAGEALGVTGPAHTFSPMNIYQLKLAAGETIRLEEPVQYNTALLVVGGKARINDDTEVDAGDFAVFTHEGERIALSSVGGDAAVFVFSGQPLDQPVVAHGPFVMTTQEEIMEAHRDYRMGWFGSHDF